MSGLTWGYLGVTTELIATPQSLSPTCPFFWVSRRYQQIQNDRKSQSLGHASCLVFGTSILEYPDSVLKKGYGEGINIGLVSPNEPPLYDNMI